MPAQIACSLFLLALIFANNSAAQTTGTKVEHSSEIAQFVVREILSSKPNAVVLFGDPNRCFDAEAVLCSGQKFTGAASNQVEATVRDVAKSFSRNTSKDPDAIARTLIQAPVGDPEVLPERWYHVCKANEYQDVGEVIIVRPSAVRESVAGSEWKMVVTVSVYPRRGECYGYASAREYVIGKNSEDASFSITRTRPLGGGTGRIK